jgi:hypothetical protein
MLPPDQGPGRGETGDEERLLEPVPTFKRSDRRPMPQGRFTEVTVPSPSSEPPVIEIAHSPARPSRVILPLIPSLSAPTARPPCPALRGQPCRAFAAP